MGDEGGRAAGQIVLASFLALTAACSLLASSSESLSGAFQVEPLHDAAARADAAPDACSLGTKPCAGACVSTSSPATGCAAASCGPCHAGHAASLCIDGACAVGACENGWANCNGRDDDGCEVDTAKSSQFCGSCLSSCEGSTPRCEQGTCVPRCKAVRFTAAAAHAALPSGGMSFGTGDVTFELWLARHDGFATASASLFATTDAQQDSALVVSLSPSAIMCAVTAPAPAGAGGGDVSAPLPSDGSFHHVACVRAAGVLRLYVDGVQQAQAQNANAILASGPAAFGRPTAYPQAEAAAVNLGPSRISRSARYDGSFAPRTFWLVDADTVAQYLTTRGFDGTTLYDEAGGDNDATVTSSIIATTETPCP